MWSPAAALPPSADPWDAACRHPTGPAVSMAVQKPLCMTKLRDALIIHATTFLKQAFFFLIFPMNSHASSTPQHYLLCIPGRKWRATTPDQRQAQNQQQSQSVPPPPRPAPSSGLSPRPKCSETSCSSQNSSRNNKPLPSGEPQLPTHSKPTSLRVPSLPSFPLQIQRSTTSARELCVKPRRPFPVVRLLKKPSKNSLLLFKAPPRKAEQPRVHPALLRTRAGVQWVPPLARQEAGRAGEQQPRSAQLRQDSEEEAKCVISHWQMQEAKQCCTRSPGRDSADGGCS